MPEYSAAQLRSNLDKYVQFDDEGFARFHGAMEYRSFAPKEHLLMAGEVCDFAAFLTRGCVRYYYVLPGGEERTGQFFFENGWVSDYPSFLTRQPSDTYIQALEAVDALLIRRAAIERLYDELPRADRFGRLMAEQAVMGMRRRSQALLSQSPEERYLELLRTRPKVVERIPLYYIASYLGIQPESLSRIRRRIQEEARGGA